jgi:hypothetical protein
MKQAAIAIGTLARIIIAKMAAKIDCGMKGTIEKNRPIARPVATVSRHGIHKLRWNNGREIACHHLRWRSFRCRSVLKAWRTSLR